MSQKFARSRWVKVRSLTELMTHVVTRTVDCLLCHRDNCIAIVTGPPKLMQFDDCVEPAVPVTSCSKGDDYPAVISETGVSTGTIYRLVITEPKKKS